MGLKENLATEPVANLAIREPVALRPGESVRTAIVRMRERRLGCVILTENDKPVGLFTEGMLTRLLAAGKNVLAESASGHAATDFAIVRKDEPIARVLEAMQRDNTRFVVVVDGEGKLAGLTGQKGLMEYVADHFPQQVMVQRVGSPPPKHREGA